MLIRVEFDICWYRVKIPQWGRHGSPGCALSEILLVRKSDAVFEPSQAFPLSHALQQSSNYPAAADLGELRSH